MDTQRSKKKAQNGRYALRFLRNSLLVFKV